MKRIYYYNAEIIDTILDMPFTVKLKRLKAIASNNNSEHEKQFHYLSIDHKELLKTASKLKKANDIYLSMINKFSFSSASKFNEKDIKSELKDLKIAALQLTKSLDELTYTSTVSELVYQSTTSSYNNLKNFYETNPERAKHSPDLKLNIKQQIDYIESLYKTYRVNDQGRKYDENLDILSLLTTKISSFGLTSNIYYRINNLVNNLQIKSKSILEKIDRYHYIFETRKNDIENYETIISSMISSIRTMLKQDDYNLLFETTKSLVMKVFEFNFWMKYQLTGAEILKENHSNIRIDMDNLNKFNKIAHNRIATSSLIKQDVKEGYLMNLRKNFYEIENEYDKYKKSSASALVTLDIQSQFSYLSHYFKKKDLYYSYLDEVEDQVNKELRHIINYKQISKYVENNFNAIIWFLNFTNMKLDNVSENKLNLIRSGMEKNINKADENNKIINSTKFEMNLEEIAEYLNEFKEFLVANYYLMRVNEKLLNRMTIISNRDDTIDKKIKALSNKFDNGDYYQSIDGLVRMYKVNFSK